MCNYKTPTWYVLGKWRGKSWRANDAVLSRHYARQLRLRTQDIRRAKFKYID
jgi:hypothetical protein